MLEQLIMRLKGRSWALILPLIAAVALAACGPTLTSVPAKEMPIAPPVVAVEDEWGVVKVAKGDPIKLGFAAGLSGAGIDVLGLDEQRGAELAVKDRPEVLGFKVELQVEDEQCNAEGGQTVANKFVADPQIVAVVGHMCSSSCTPAAMTYEQNGYTMVSPSCTAPSLTAPDTGTKAFNRVCWNDVMQGAEVAKFAYEKLGIRKAATIHDGSPYAEQLGREFAKNFEALGGKVVAAEAVNVGDTDMRPVLTRIKAGEPELIYWSGFVAEGGYLAAQMPDVGMDKVLFMGADGIKADEFIKAAGARAEGVYASAANPAEAGAAMPKFLEAYETTYGEKPIAPFHAHAYDASMVILNAIEKVGKVDADGSLLIGRKALNEAIRGTKGYQGLTGTITCNEFGDCGTGTVAVSVVKDGQWAAAEVVTMPKPEETVILELARVIETKVPVEVKNRQPLQLDIVDTGAGRLHFRLEIDADDYPPGDDFKLEVMAVPSETIAKVCWDQKVCEEYPEVIGVTEDGRLIILVVSTEYVAASPYAFSVTGIDKFANPVSVSISVDIPPEEISKDHGIIIYHEDDRTIEHFPAELIQEGDFFRLASSDDPDDPDYYAPIYRCCREYGH